MNLEVLRAFVKHSPSNICQPLSLLREEAESTLSTDAQISFELILSEFSKIPLEEQKKITYLLIVGTHTMDESFEIGRNISELHQNTIQYVCDHPEYGRKLDTEALMKNLLDSDE